MTPEDSIDQLVERVGPNIEAPDPRLIREEAARQAQTRGLAQRAAVGICAVLLMFGAFAVFNQDDATSVATTDENSDAEPPAVPASSPDGRRPDIEMGTQFEDWMFSNKTPSPITSVRALARDSDPATDRVRLSLMALPLDGGFEYFAIFSAWCGPELFFGMFEFDGNNATFRNGQLPAGTNIDFDATGWACEPPRPTRLENILDGGFELSFGADGIAFFNGADGVTFQVTDLDWNPLTAETEVETTSTSAVPNASMSDVMLLASASEVFHAERFENIATEYADRCGWSLAGSTGGEFDEGIDVTVGQVTSLLVAINCEGGLVVRTSGEVLASELSSDALVRLETVGPELPFIVQVDGPPAAPVTTTSPASTEPTPTTTPEVQAGFSVSEGPVGNEQTLSFTESGTGDASSFEWQFGDGATSTERSPTHSYASAGTYSVRLTAFGPAGSRSIVEKSVFVMPNTVVVVAPEGS